MVSHYAPLATRFVRSLPAPRSVVAAVEPDDARLIAAARSGNAAAYGSLVRKYQDRLCSSLCHICGSMADAQDAAQEAFLRAYLKLSTYTGASAFYTWLYRIAVNAVISEHRKRQSRSETERRRSQPALAPGPPSERPDQRLLREEGAAQVQSALEALSDEHRAILILREIEDFDYEQIANALAIPVGTVRSRLYRARLELRKELDRVPDLLGG